MSEPSPSGCGQFVAIEKASQPIFLECPHVDNDHLDTSKNLGAVYIRSVFTFKDRVAIQIYHGATFNRSVTTFIHSLAPKQRHICSPHRKMWERIVAGKLV